MQIDTLLCARWVIPVEPDQQVLEHHAVAIHAGRILELLPVEEAERKYQPAQRTVLERHALIPGLVNAHSHVAMSLMRGLGGDLPLMRWLKEHIWPAESRWVGADFVRDGSLLACAEMLRAGVTCVNDMYFFPEDTARAVEQAGMRAVVGLILIDFPSAWARDADDYLRRGLELHDRLHNHPLITTCFAPHAPYTVSDAPLTRVATLAEELDLSIHMHVHETEDEVRQAVATTGQRPLARLQTLGLLSPRLLAVHMTQLDEGEIEAVAAAGVHVIHCPESNLKLASGLCPVQRLTDAGVNVALGTDGAASNNDLDMLGEMRTAALVGKLAAADASAVPANLALRMATLHGARALGLDQEIGSLEPGKAADIVAVDLGDLESMPVYHPISQLVYAGGRDKVTDVWVAGRQLLRERALTTLDEHDIARAAAEWGLRIRGADEAQSRG